VLSLKFISKLSSTGASFPVGFEFAPDGSLRLTGDATVWNDQITNRISPDDNIVTYTLAETDYESYTDYAVYKGKVWVKANIKPGQTVKFKFIRDSTGAANPKNVFLLYDDFNGYDYSLWDYSNSSVSGSILSVNGGNLVQGAQTKNTIPSGVIIEWNMYSGNYDFDSGIKVGNLYFISDRGTGYHAISTGFTYPGGSQTANAWNEYRVILESNRQTFVNITNSKTVVANYTYSPGTLRFVCDSDTSSNPLRVDYICVRKLYDENQVTVTVTEITDGYEVDITNTGADALEEVQIPIDIPADYYKVTVTNTSPVLETYAFPPGVTSSIKFFTQFNHSPKYYSDCAFHIHTYIPPDADSGTVKLRLSWEKLPVEVIINDSGANDLLNFNKKLSVVTKTFTITEDMKGRHVLLNFGRIDKVHSLSQIVFHKLERLGDDPEDTWSHPLPVLYVDWHTEMDSIGSQDEFKK